jgi:hypothetical protein
MEIIILRLESKQGFPENLFILLISYVFNMDEGCVIGPVPLIGNGFTLPCNIHSESKDF